MIQKLRRVLRRNRRSLPSARSNSPGSNLVYIANSLDPENHPKVIGESSKISVQIGLHWAALKQPQSSPDQVTVQVTVQVVHSFERGRTLEEQSGELVQFSDTIGSIVSNGAHCTE